MDVAFVSLLVVVQGLSQGVDQGGALGPADMVALAAAYPFIFIKVSPLVGKLTPPQPSQCILFWVAFARAIRGVQCDCPGLPLLPVSVNVSRTPTFSKTCVVQF